LGDYLGINSGGAACGFGDSSSTRGAFLTARSSNADIRCDYRNGSLRDFRGRALRVQGRQELVIDVSKVPLRDLEASARRGDVGALVDVVHDTTRGHGALGEAVDIDVRGHSGLLGHAEREPERLARLAQRLVAGDQRRARVGRVLVRANDVKPIRRAERLLAPRNLELLECHPEADSIDLRAALGRHDGDDLIREAERERAPSVVDGEVNVVPLTKLAEKDKQKRPLVRLAERIVLLPPSAGGLADSKHRACYGGFGARGHRRPKWRMMRLFILVRIRRSTLHISSWKELQRLRVKTFIGVVAANTRRKCAQARGVRFGRKLKLTAHQRKEVLKRRSRGEALVEIARSYAVSHSTISRL